MRHEIPADQAPIALGLYLSRALPELPPWALRQMLKDRQIKAEGARLGEEDLVFGGQTLTLYLPKTLAQAAPSAPVRLPVVYEDQHILLVNKPQGLPSEGQEGEESAQTLARAHLAATGQLEARALLCHRLDAQTGGLLLLAKDEATEALLADAFRKRKLVKEYTCQVVGTPDPPQATLWAYLRKDEQAARVSIVRHAGPGAKQIITEYQVLQPGGSPSDTALLRVILHTGRTHQIRAHLAAIGHPVLGDDKYGDRAANRLHKARNQRLWATSLTLRLGGHLAYLDGKTFTAPPGWDKV